MYELGKYWAKETRERERRTRVVLEAIKPFEERLDRLHLLAESAKDPADAVSYMMVAREMDEELGLVADALFHSRLDSAGLPAALEDWNSKGRAHLIQHGMNSAAANQVFDSAATVVERDEVWAWVERGGVDLGHVEMMARVEARANSAHHAGDRDTAWQLDAVADQLEQVHQEDGLAAIQTAVELPAEDRPAYLRSRETAIRQRVQRQIARLVDDIDLTIPQPVGSSAVAVFAEAHRRRHEDHVENSVRAAYDMLLWADPGPRRPRNPWLPLAALRGELDRQARATGNEPHTREDIDAALRRLARNESPLGRVTFEDHMHVRTATDLGAALRFEGDERFMIRIDYSDYEQPGVEQSESADHENSAGRRARGPVRPEGYRASTFETTEVERDAGGPAL